MNEKLIELIQDLAVAAAVSVLACAAVINPIVAQVVHQFLR